MSENTKINSTFQNLINVIKSKVDAKQEPILSSGENIEDKLNELNTNSLNSSSIITTIKTITSTKPKVEPHWEPYTWNGDFGPYGLSVWSDGENIYDTESTESKKLNKNTNTWENITWIDQNNFFGEQVWTDGDNIYYSDSSVYILNEEKTGWIRDSNLSNNTIIPWTDGINIYAGKKRLDKINHIWVDQTWYGELPNGIGGGRNVWTDGENIYGYANQTHYILNKDTFTWSQTTFNGNFQLGFQVRNIWSDGNNIYYSYQRDQKILNKSTNTWEDKTWNLSGSILWGFNIWSDGKNIYLSRPHDINQYILRH